MFSHDPSATSEAGNPAGGANNSPEEDGLDTIELSNLDASPPRLAVEQDLMQLARLGELRAIQRLFDSGKYNAKSMDEQGITALHVRLECMEYTWSTSADSMGSGLLSTVIMRFATFSSSLEPM
jgi:hypothetical protein